MGKPLSSFGVGNVWRLCLVRKDPKTSSLCSCSCLQIGTCKVKMSPKTIHTFCGQNCSSNTRLHKLDILFASLTAFQEAAGSIISYLSVVKNNWIECVAGEWHGIAWGSAECLACCGFQEVSLARQVNSSSPSLHPLSLSLMHLEGREQPTVSLQLKQLKLIKSKSLLSKRPWIQLDQKPLVKQPLKVYQKFISMVIYLGKRIKMLIEMFLYVLVFKGRKVEDFLGRKVELSLYVSSCHSVIISLFSYASFLFFYFKRKEQRTWYSKDLGLVPRLVLVLMSGDRLN